MCGLICLITQSFRKRATLSALIQFLPWVCVLISISRVLLEIKISHIDYIGMVYPVCVLTWITRTLFYKIDLSQLLFLKWILSLIYENWFNNGYTDMVSHQCMSSGVLRLFLLYESCQNAYIDIVYKVCPHMVLSLLLADTSSSNWLY